MKDDDTSDARLFGKTQNIIRNLGIHKNLLRLLQLDPEDGTHLDTLARVIKFFARFSVDNLTN
jgi:hypothetical protein